MCSTDPHLSLLSGPVDIYDKAKQNGHVIAFVLSDGFFQDPRDACRFCLDHTCPEDYRNMIFILLQPISAKFLEDKEVGDATKSSINVGRKIHWPSGIDLQEFLRDDEHEEEADVGQNARKWQKPHVAGFIKRLRLEMPPLPTSRAGKTPTKQSTRTVESRLRSPRESASSARPLLHIGNDMEEIHEDTPALGISTWQEPSGMSADSGTVCIGFNGEESSHRIAERRSKGLQDSGGFSPDIVSDEDPFDISPTASC